MIAEEIIKPFVESGSKFDIEKDVTASDGTRLILFTEVDGHADDETGGEKIVSLKPGATAELLAADSSLDSSSVGSDYARLLDLPVAPASDDVAPSSSWKGELDLDSSVSSSLGIPLDGRTAQQLINSAIVASAEECVGKLSNASMVETSYGRRGCAWAVNAVVKRALGRPVGGGLKTASMITVLRSFDTHISIENASPGSIIISPTTGKRVGHVGIVGANGVVFSNSSATGIFSQNYTVSGWYAAFKKRELPTEFFDLNPRRFPSAGA